MELKIRVGSDCARGNTSFWKVTKLRMWEKMDLFSPDENRFNLSGDFDFSCVISMRKLMMHLYAFLQERAGYLNDWDGQMFGCSPVNPFSLLIMPKVFLEQGKLYMSDDEKQIGEYLLLQWTGPSENIKSKRFFLLDLAPIPTCKFRLVELDFEKRFDYIPAPQIVLAHYRGYNGQMMADLVTETSVWDGALSVYYDSSKMYRFEGWQDADLRSLLTVLKEYPYGQTYLKRYKSELWNKYLAYIKEHGIEH